MIDTRAVAQEVQDQLLAAMRRGQDQMRKSQEQMRKNREAVAEVIRTGNQLAKAVRPSMPTLPKPTVHVPSLSQLASPAKLRASAQELSEHVIATQRSLTDKATPVAEQFVARQRELAEKAFHAATPVAEQFVARQRELAEKAFHAASPFVAESVARLTEAVGTLQDGRRPGRRRTAQAVPAAETVAPAEAPHLHAVPTETEADAVASATVVEAGTKEPAATPAKARAAKPRTPKAATPKAATPTASTAKARTAKASTAKPGPRESASRGKTTVARKSPGTSTSKARSPKK